MIISLGAGTTQAAVVSMSGIVSAETSRTAGLRIDEAIVNYVRRKYGLIIGQTTAEQLKLNIGAAIPTEDEKTMEIQGQDQVSGLPKPASLTTNEIVDAMQPPLEEIVSTIRRVLEKTPPELISDIIDRGVALCGGTSLMKGLDKYLMWLGIGYVVENPVTCTLKVWRNIPMWKSSNDAITLNPKKIDFGRRGCLLPPLIAIILRMT